MSFHTILIVGRLGRDPDMRYTPSGQAVTNFNVAANRQYTDVNEQPVKETIWFRISAFGKTAENCNEYLHKGSLVLVEGRLVSDPETGGPHIWESGGKTGASFEVNASTVRFLSGREIDDNKEPSNAGVANAPNSDIPF